MQEELNFSVQNRLSDKKRQSFSRIDTLLHSMCYFFLGPLSGAIDIEIVCNFPVYSRVMRGKMLTHQEEMWRSVGKGTEMADLLF